MRVLTGKTCLITGASRGVGRGLALELGKAGVRLALGARNHEALEALADDVALAGGDRPEVLPVDLTSVDDARAFAKRAAEALGQVDIIVNNAAMIVKAAQADVGDADVARRMFEANYWSPLALIHELSPEMRRRGSGVIVNVTSMAPLTPVPLLGYYAASKAALTAASDALSEELRPAGITVVQVMLGPVMTDLLAEAVAGTGTEWLSRRLAVSPSRAARHITTAIEKGQARSVCPRLCVVPAAIPALARSMSQFLVRKQAGLVAAGERDPRH
ncbi:MAG: SDR family NAD(P)-dependent oxidoreductase [Actinomycetota bacterium]